MVLHNSTELRIQYLRAYYYSIGKGVRKWTTYDSSLELRIYFSKQVKHHRLRQKTLICSVSVTITESLNFFKLPVSHPKNRWFKRKETWVLCKVWCMPVGWLPAGLTKVWSDISLKMTLTQANSSIWLAYHKAIIPPSPGQILKKNPQTNKKQNKNYLQGQK